MNNKSEPFTLELSKEFDRYMSIIDILDKKAHNLIIISSTFIAVLLGTISIHPGVDNLLTDHNYYIFIPIGISSFVNIP